MYGVPFVPTVAERAKWLAEVATTLEQAQQLLMKLELTHERRSILLDLHVRIEAAKLEIQSLRRSRSITPRGELDRDRTELSPWTFD